MIRAVLDRDDTCAALGVTARSSPMDVYRGDTLALRVPCIGEAARLQVNARGTGFIARQAAPMYAELKPLLVDTEAAMARLGP